MSRLGAALDGSMEQDLAARMNAETPGSSRPPVPNVAPRADLPTIAAADSASAELSN
jgi:hypothetical protein